MDEWTPGELFDLETRVGPLIGESQAEWVEGLVDDAVDRGATLVHDEQFGPVCPVTTFDDRTEAVDLVNEGDQDGGAVFTAESDRAMAVAERFDAGAVRINGAPTHELGDVPFGDSGIGREGLHTSIEAYLRTKSIILWTLTSTRPNGRRATGSAPRDF